MFCAYQSDDEAYDAYDDASNELTESEVEEANELIASQGLIDFSVTGRKPLYELEERFRAHTPGSLTPKKEGDTWTDQV